MNIKLHRPLTILLGLALSLAVLAACYPPTNLPTESTDTTGNGATSSGSRSPASQIEGVEWQLVSVGRTPAVPASEATMALDNGQIAGTTGCNRYGGSYELSDARGITFGPLATTQMACAEPIMAQEQAFTQALSATTSYSVSGGILTLKDSSGAELATFAQRAATSLTGTSWLALGVNNGKQAVASVVAGSEVTAVFGADGTLSGKAGCNDYSAPYTVDGNKLTIKEPIATRMYCNQPGVMDQEQAYLAALTQVASYSIDGNRLQLRSADGALQVDYTAK